MRSFALLILAAVALSGCSGKEAPIVTMIEPEPLSLPAECTAPDAAWLPLSNADVKRSDAVKQHDTNKGRYNRILVRRSVCRAAINAAMKG